MITSNLIINLFLILTVAWMLGIVFSRMGLPAMLGELLAGVILGPPLLGIVSASAPIELLAELGAIDREGRITAHGKEMGRLPMHPRLAHMLVAGKAAGHGRLACDIAALLEERDLLGPGAPADMALRLEALRDPRAFAARPYAVDAGARARVKQNAARLRRRRAP